MCFRTPDVAEVRDDTGISWFAPLFLITGLSIIGRFVFREAVTMREIMEKETENVKFTFAELLAARVDLWFSGSATFKPLALLALSFLLIVGGAVCFTLFANSSFSAALWTSWAFVADPGNHADQTESAARIISFLLTIGGMLVFALVIGIVGDEISEKVDELKRGKSRVIEQGHVLILGWSDKTIAIIKELAIANESEGGGVIVVLDERDKEEMEELIFECADDLRGTTVVVRSGSTISMADLNKVSAKTAKSIIVLSNPEVNTDESDARAVRTMLSLNGLGEKRAHIVVEMCDVDNRELVQLVGQGGVETMVAHDIIGRLMIQCACQPGLSQVMQRLLGFEGSEFYLKEWPELVGMTFGEVVVRCEGGVPIGYKPKDGTPIVNPPDSSIFHEGDELMVLAEDDDTYTITDTPHKVAPVRLPDWQPSTEKPRNILFCGWRRDMDDMIKELDMTVPAGSKLWLMASVPVNERRTRLTESGRSGEEGLQNITLVHWEGDPTLRRHLEHMPLEAFDSVLILADETLGSDMQAADSQSLATLLLVRDIRVPPPVS